MSDRLIVYGDERKYELWEIKFLGYMRTQKFYSTITAGIGDEINPNKNAEAFGELVQHLDY